VLDIPPFIVLGLGAMVVVVIFAGVVVVVETEKMK